MPNHAIEVINELTTNQFSFLQKIGELNLKTAETLRTQQLNFIQEYVDFGKQYTEGLLKAPVTTTGSLPNQELVNGFNTKWLNNWRETAEVFKAYSEEFKATTENSLKSFQSGTTQLIEVSKQAASEATEKTKAAVESATAEVIDLSKTAIAQTNEAVKKVANKA